MKSPLLLSILSYGLFRLSWYLTGEQYLSLLVFLIPIGFLILNLLLRRKLKFQKWFTSNFLLERKHQSFSSDIPPELLFEKIKAVVRDADLQLMDEAPEQLQLLTTTSVNFFTWGENIYIKIDPIHQSISVTSVTIFGSYSWQRNQDNYDQFYRDFEASLTI